MLRSIAARASTDASTDSGRCDASRSMRATSIARPHPSRGAHARSTLRERLRMRAPQDEDSIAFRPSSRCQTAHLVPAAHCVRPGFATLLHLPRVEGWAERRETFGCSAEHPWGVPSCVKDARERAYDAARQALARRLTSHDAGRSPLGAPPWRFWASGPRFRLLRCPPPYNGGHSPSDPCSELLAARS